MSKFKNLYNNISKWLQEINVRGETFNKATQIGGTYWVSENKETQIGGTYWVYKQESV